MEKFFKWLTDKNFEALHFFVMCVVLPSMFPFSEQIVVGFVIVIVCASAGLIAQAKKESTTVPWLIDIASVVISSLIALNNGDSIALLVLGLAVYSGIMLLLYKDI